MNWQPVVMSCGFLYVVFALAILLSIFTVTGNSDDQSARMKVHQERELHPAVGESCMGQGEVLENRRIYDSVGKFFGLCVLVVYRAGDGYPDIDVWIDMLPTDADIKYAVPDRDRTGTIRIWYKLAWY